MIFTSIASFIALKNSEICTILLALFMRKPKHGALTCLMRDHAVRYMEDIGNRGD